MITNVHVLTFRRKKLNNSMTVHVFRIVVLIYQICIKYFVIKNIFVNNSSCEIYIRKLCFIYVLVYMVALS